MYGKKKPMRFAHSEGHTDVCYSDDGKFILTCGIDGDVRIWEGLEDDDPTSQAVGGEHALTVMHKGDHYYVGTDNNNVQSYTFPGSSADGIITRFTAAVTHMAVSSDGKKIVAGSCDMEIHICTINSSKRVILTGHKAPILGVALDPKNTYVASSSCDGTVRVWTVEDGKSVKTWDCIPSCNSFYLAKCLGRPSWQAKTGRYLAVPHKNEIQLFERGTWNKILSLSHESVNQDFSISTFSPCGSYLAGCTIGGHICVWDVNLQLCVVNIRHDRGHSICGLVWNPNGKGELAYCDVMGQLGTIEECIPSTEENSSSTNNNSSSINKEKSITVEDMVQLNSLDDDDDDDNIGSIQKLEAELSLPTFGEDVEKSSHADANFDAESLVSVGMAPKCDLQPPFQPSSTPVHLQHRFMVWNSVGIVKCYNTETENSIDVEFHDSSLHHALHINNFLKHTMSTLSEVVLVMACETQDEIPSKVVCVLLNSWDGSKEWSVEMPEGEEVLAVAAAQDWIAVATDTRNLRIFTIAGTQREVVSLPGPVVCVSGCGNKLLAIFHNGMGLPGDQSLGFIIFSVTSGLLQAISPVQPLPMAPKSTLKWAGFSDEGTPFTLDSAGIMRMFTRNGYWLPVCDTQSRCSGKSDHYFVIGISETYQNIRCVLCKGSYYPATAPRPAVTEISLQVPLCESATEKSLLEEKFWRSQVMCKNMDYVHTVDESEKKLLENIIKESVIKLFSLACRSGLEFRAVELCSLMPTNHAVQLAMKYASKLGKMNLADKIADVATAKMEKAERNLNNDHYNFHLLGHSDAQARIPQLLSNHVNNSYEEDNLSRHSTTERDHTENDIVVTEPESILLTAKQKKTEIKPVTFLSQDSLNPFKKTIVKTENGRCLANLESSFTKKQSTKNSVITEQPSVQQTEKRQTKLTLAKSVSKSVATPDTSKQVPTFFEWYEKEQGTVAEKFPDLSASELSRQALKYYKELVKNNKLVPSVTSQSESQEEVESSGGKKRKLDSENQEDTNMLSKQKVTSSSLSESQEEVESWVERKRKLDSENRKDAKMPSKEKVTSSSSKLLSFVFKKS